MKKSNKKYLLKINKKIVKNELEHIYLNFLIFNQKYQGLKIIFLLILMKKHKRESSITRFQNRCLVTYNKRSVLKQYQLTRMKIKEFGLMGILAGLRKSSW